MTYPGAGLQAVQDTLGLYLAAKGASWDRCPLLRPAFLRCSSSNLAVKPASADKRSQGGMLHEPLTDTQWLIVSMPFTNREGAHWFASICGQ